MTGASSRAGYSGALRVKKPKRLLLPTTLVLASACPGPSPRPPCGTDPYDMCRPDGGYWCPGEGCANAVADDGGVLFDSKGNPVCLC
jgi:hypothetical protein